jgi:homogentisate 1,2-dioxygenase
VQAERAGHGPDVASWKAASGAELKPHKIEGTMAFMVESCWPFRPTGFAMGSDALQADYDAAWGGFPKAELP